MNVFLIVDLPLSGGARDAWCDVLVPPPHLDGDR
jgi:hypothetical protein